MVEISKKFDLHGHTTYSFPWEGVQYRPVDVLSKVKQIGFDGVAITGHNTVTGLQKALDIASESGVILIPGIEITSYLSRRTPHILALGIDPQLVARFSIPFGKSPQDVIRWIHNYGGLAIAAHPSETPKLTALTHTDILRLRDQLDGIEVMTLSGHNSTLQKLADDNHLAGTGGSDFHLLSQIGLAGTHIFGNINTWQEAIVAIRQRKIETFIQNDIPKELQTARANGGIMNRILNFGK